MADIRPASQIPSQPVPNLNTAAPNPPPGTGLSPPVALIRDMTLQRLLITALANDT